MNTVLVDMTNINHGIKVGIQYVVTVCFLVVEFCVLLLCICRCPLSSVFFVVALHSLINCLHLILLMFVSLKLII
jgi:hypothetical protein